MVKHNLPTNNSVAHAKKPSSDAKQRTLFQCWRKNDDATNDAEITIIDAVGSSTLSVTPPSDKIPQTKTFKNGWNPTSKSQRRCPFYKKVEGTPYVVDAFNYALEDAIKGYFLSHFHSDHYVGLGSKFSRSVYCSEVTADLVRHSLKVPTRLLIPLPMDKTTDMPDGTRVHLLNANHCPGAVIFVFQLKNSRIIVHTGDMRADDSVLTSCQALFSQLPPVNALHLDTTYCDASYQFPSQHKVISELIERVRIECRQKKRLLIVVGAYQIGKERVFKAIADALDTKIYVSREKWDVLRMVKDPALCQRLTLVPGETPLHVVAMNRLNSQALAEYLSNYSDSYDSILGISATGWEFGRSRDGWRITRRGNTTTIGVPYSEHSSFTELKRFVQLIRPLRIIPTVNVGSESSRRKMQETFSLWLK